MHKNDKHTILRGFGPLFQSLSPSPVWKTIHPEVPLHLLPRNQESHGKWTVGCSWMKTHRGRYGSLASIKVNDMIREIRKDDRVGTFEVGLICRPGGVTIRVMHQAKRVCYLAVNWVLLCIADPLEQRCFPSIRPPDNENTEMGVLGSDFRSLFWVNRYPWCTSCRKRIRWRYSNRWGRSSGWMWSKTEGAKTMAEGEFERLGGVPCDPLPNTFFRRLRNPLDSFCRGILSAISMRDGDKKGLAAVGHPRGFSSGWARKYL